MRVKLTPAFVQKATCPPSKAREYFWDTSMAGFALLVTSAQHKSYVAQGRISRSRSPRKTFKGTLPLATAKREAKQFIGDVARGVDSLAEERAKARHRAGTLQSVYENYCRFEGGKLRSFAQRDSAFRRLILPTLGATPVDSIKRSDVVKLLDRVASDNGPVQADHVLSYLHRLFNWHAIRDDSFRSPLVRGMARTNAKERARSRILSDDELVRVWRAAGETNGPFGAYVKFVLLTACRRDEARCLRRDEIDGTNWVLPSARNKVKTDLVRPLSAAARGVLAELPRIGNSDFYFTLSGAGPVGALAKFKARFDVACGVTGWTLHDLRRTARSLMSRAEVSADIGEICLGHTLGGVRGIYDRHEYLQEKARAFELLAREIERIVTPPPANVIPLRTTVS